MDACPSHVSPARTRENGATKHDQNDHTHAATDPANTARLATSCELHAMPAHQATAQEQHAQANRVHRHRWRTRNCRSAACADFLRNLVGSATAADTIV